MYVYVYTYTHALLILFLWRTLNDKYFDTESGSGKWNVGINFPNWFQSSGIGFLFWLNLKTFMTLSSGKIGTESSWCDAAVKTGKISLFNTLFFYYSFNEVSFKIFLLLNTCKFKSIFLHELSFKRPIFFHS